MYHSLFYFHLLVNYLLKHDMIMPHACYLALKFAASFIFLGILLTGNNLTLHTYVVWFYLLITIDKPIFKTFNVGCYCYSNNNYIYIDNWVLLHKILRLSHTSHGTKKDLSHETLNNVPATTDLNMRKRKHSIWVVWKTVKQICSKHACYDKVNMSLSKV